MSEVATDCARAYPKYTVIAERYHARCPLELANTPTKDYFYMWVLLSEDRSDSSHLGNPIYATFKRQAMSVPTALPVGLSDSFADDAVKPAQWAAFLKKNGLASLPLASAVERIKTEIIRINVR